MPFSCSICAEESTRICVRCTKDSCDNHLCDKCRKCSDCCECEVALTPHPQETVREAMHAAVAHDEPAPEVVAATLAAVEAAAAAETPVADEAPVAVAAPAIETPAAVEAPAIVETTPEAIAPAEPAVEPAPAAVDEAPAMEEEAPVEKIIPGTIDGVPMSIEPPVSEDDAESDGPPPSADEGR